MSLRRVGRAVTAPVRGYLNGHFEMVKQEIRDHAATPVQVEHDAVDRRLAELQRLLAEQAHHDAQVLAGLRDELSALHERVAELERVVRQLAAVVAAPRPE